MKKCMPQSPSALLIRTMERNAHRIEVIFQEFLPVYSIHIKADIDEVGVLFRLCAVLFRYGWNIETGKLGSGKEYTIDDEFSLSPLKKGATIDLAQMRQMLDDFETLLFGQLSVLEYLADCLPEKENQVNTRGSVQVVQNAEFATIEVEGEDKSGLLLILAQAFFLMDINIGRAEISTVENRIKNSFRIKGRDPRFDSKEFCARLKDELQNLV